MLSDPPIPGRVFGDAREATAEIEKLRRANQSLMEALREEKEVRVKVEGELMHAQVSCVMSVHVSVC